MLYWKLRKMTGTEAEWCGETGIHEMSELIHHPVCKQRKNKKYGIGGKVVELCLLFFSMRYEMKCFLSTLITS